MPRQKPKIITNSVAHRYDSANEHTIEYSFNDGKATGGLVNFSHGSTEGDLRVNPYRHDPGITFIIGKADGDIKPHVEVQPDGTVIITFPH